MKFSLLLVPTLFLCATARANVSLPGIFGDHMVLQAGQKIPVWGWADAGEEVTVTLGIQSAKTVADNQNRWRVDLPKTEANDKPQQLIVTGKNTVTFDDVLVGEVWLCSGQSNMEFGVYNIKKKDEIATPEIRVFCVTKSASLAPLDNTEFVPQELVWDTLSGHWQKGPAAGSWNGFSAIGYLFGQRIQKMTGHPVGMIGSYWGGTPVQAWTSLTALQKDPKLDNYVKGFQNLRPDVKARFPVVWADYIAAMRKWDKEVAQPDNKAMAAWKIAAAKAHEAGQPEPAKPEPTGKRPANPGNVGTTTTLFNGMINPLIPYGIKGVIWYQGESNTNNSADYARLFATLIKDWRSRWGQGDFPFLFVQLAGYQPPTTDPSRGKWADLRAAQAKVLYLPNTGMATAVDVGDANNIHPKDKDDVAKRLALLAQNRVYGQQVVDSGPVFTGMKIEGDKIRVQFKNVGGGLTSKTPELTGFEIADAKGVWQAAQAKIDQNEVIVWSDAVPAPVAVRYAWADFPACSLYNREGLPAFPFNTLAVAP